MKQKSIAHLRIAGPDKMGIIARTTSFLYENRCNIEDIDQRILDGYLIMNMWVDVSQVLKRLSGFEKSLKEAAASIGVSAELRLKEARQVKNAVMLVSHEDHCAKSLLAAFNTPGSPRGGRFVAIIGNHPDLEPLAKRYKIPFHLVPSTNRKQHEAEILKLLDRYAVDLIALARYMQILSPDFVFRHEGRIVNIHPSLLPAFPGPRAYHQAHNKGVDWIGVTAHFVTTDLDEGPIICQEAIRVDKNKDSVEEYIRKGQALEAKALTKAVSLFLVDRLFLRRGKVLDSKKMRELQKTTQAFYSPAHS